MAYEEENIVQEWLDYLKDLNVETKKMFGCYCLYCDGQAVGWMCYHRKHSQLSVGRWISR